MSKPSTPPSDFNDPVYLRNELREWGRLIPALVFQFRDMQKEIAVLRSLIQERSAPVRSNSRTRGTTAVIIPFSAIKKQC